MARRKDVNQFLNLRGGYAGFNNPGGVVYWVGASGYAAYDGASPANSNDGLSPQEPFSTIQYALDQCVSGRGDIVAVLPGNYTVTAALTMTKDDVTLCSAQPVGPRERGPAVIVNATDVNTLTINANNCKVEGITFDDNVAAATADTASIFVNSASTAVDYTGTIIRNCFIDATGADATDRDGITLGTDADDGALHSLVDGCVVLGAGGDAIKVNVGSEYSVIRNCLIHDYEGTSNETIYGVEVLAVYITISDCDITVTTSAGACIHNGVAAAQLTVNRCNLHAIGANTTCILVINTATQRTAGCYMTATAAHNLVDYLTACTSPSSDTNFYSFYAADPAGGEMTSVSVAGA